jgi:spore coat protein A, manganese oxidase
MELRRRDVLKLGLFSSAALALPAERIARTKDAFGDQIATSKLPKPFTIGFDVPPVLTPAKVNRTYDCYKIDQIQSSVEILPGLRTPIWGYNGITPGPTIRVHRGRPAIVRQCNELPARHPQLRYNVWTSTHLHGSASLPQYDGYASDTTGLVQYKDYRYPNFQNARTLWYHDHGVHITAPNAYMGLAAFYIMHDDLELGLPIPHGKYDVPLVLRDAMFTKKGELIFDDRSESSLMGDVILANGKPWPVMKVERRKYRFRLLNAAISRSFLLKLSSGEPMYVIGTDGGLMPAPAPTTELRFGMAERYEVIIDFAKYKVGERVILQNGRLPNNRDEANTDKVMAFDIVGDATDTSGNEIPAVINPHNEVMALQPSQSVKTRKLAFERKHSEWTVNGQIWDDVVRSGYQKVVANPKLNDVEIWELENRSGGWFHPVHIHLIDFKILDRNGKPPLPYEMGPKDVAYVGENETVRVIAKFGPHEGRYMIHCHNLVHEDHDMMVQFQVGENREDNDPRLADPCKDMPDPDFEDEALEEQREAADEAAEEARRAAEEAAEEAAEAAEKAAKADADALQQAQEAGGLEGTTP